MNRENLKIIPRKSGTRKGYLLSPYVFNIVLEVLGKKTESDQWGINWKKLKYLSL